MVSHNVDRIDVDARSDCAAAAEEAVRAVDDQLIRSKRFDVGCDVLGPAERWVAFPTEVGAELVSCAPTGEGRGSARRLRTFRERELTSLPSEDSRVVTIFDARVDVGPSDHVEDVGFKAGDGGSVDVEVFSVVDGGDVAPPEEGIFATVVAA
jgi:hypothetical protein